MERGKGHLDREAPRSSYVGIDVRLHLSSFIKKKKVIVPLYKASAPVKYYLVLSKIFTDRFNKSARLFFNQIIHV